MSQIKTKKEAVRNGDKTYFGHACDRGHNRRIVAGGKCYYCEHSDKVRASHQQTNEQKAMALVKKTLETMSIQATADRLGVSFSTINNIMRRDVITEKVSQKILENSKVPLEARDPIEKHKNNIMYTQWRKTA